jgi:hypothetical protein
MIIININALLILFMRDEQAKSRDTIVEEKKPTKRFHRNQYDWEEHLLKFLFTLTAKIKSNTDSCH